MAVVLYIHGANTRDSDLRPGALKLVSSKPSKTSSYRLQVANLKKRLKRDVFNHLADPVFDFQSCYWGNDGAQLHWTELDWSLPSAPEPVAPERQFLSNNPDDALLGAALGWQLPPSDPKRARAMIGASAQANLDEFYKRLGIKLDGKTKTQLEKRIKGKPPAQVLDLLASAPSGDGRKLLGPEQSVVSTIREALNDVRESVRTTVLDFRRDTTRNISRVLGDALQYTATRGQVTPPGGEIVFKVHAALRKAHALAKEQRTPLVVLTFCMGGTIVYDVLTHYGKDLHVDAWVSVGSHVTQYENLKLFMASDRKIAAPNRVSRPKNVDYWLNMLDPHDGMAFKAAPVFDGVDDLLLPAKLNLVKVHGSYFNRNEFYAELQGKLRDHLKSARPKRKP